MLVLLFILFLIGIYHRLRRALLAAMQFGASRKIVWRSLHAEARGEPVFSPLGSANRAHVICSFLLLAISVFSSREDTSALKMTTHLVSSRGFRDSFSSQVFHLMEMISLLELCPLSSQSCTWLCPAMEPVIKN